MKFQKRFATGDRPASGKTAELEQAAERLSRFHRVSWKEALGKVASPALRLHRYRNAHDRLLQSALAKRDCPDAGDCCP